MNKPRSPQRKDPEFTKAVSNRLKEIRAIKGFSQEYVQENTNLNIPRMEAGTLNVSLVSLKIFCKFCEISLSDFFKDFETE